MYNLDNNDHNNTGLRSFSLALKSSPCTVVVVASPASVVRLSLLLLSFSDRSNCCLTFRSQLLLLLLILFSFFLLFIESSTFLSFFQASHVFGESSKQTLIWCQQNAENILSLSLSLSLSVSLSAFLWLFGLLMQLFESSSLAPAEERLLPVREGLKVGGYRLTTYSR